MEFMIKDGLFGVNARTVGGFSVVGLKDMLNGRHCVNVSSNVYGMIEVFLPPPGGKHDELLEGWILITSDTGPVPTPFPSSNEAMKVIPAANGKNVTAAPVLVFASQASGAIIIDSGFVELNGRIVSERGNAAGALPPIKETLKGPHCVTDEKVIESKARTSCDP